MIKLLTIMALTLCVFITHNAPSIAAPKLLEDQTKAVILAYHRIGEDQYPSSNLRLEQFIEHLQEIRRGDYNVISLGDLIDATQTDRKLPDRTIAITFEGAYASAHHNAMQLLLEAKIPFTVFYASAYADQNRPGYMTWDDLKTLSTHNLVTIASLPSTQSHIAHKSEQDILKNLNIARQRHREEFGAESLYLSYPFGEYSPLLQKLVKQQGFKAGVGLHSGATYSGTDIFALPRFSMTESYGDLERFRLVTNALPLPVTDRQPQNMDITNQTFSVGFTLPRALENQPLSCFLSGHEKPAIERLGTRIELRINKEKNEPKMNRMRLNCTMPAPQSDDETQRWRWLGLLLHRNQNETMPEPDALP